MKTSLGSVFGTVSASVCALGLMGCATTPTPPDEATPVPTERLLLHTTANDADTTVVVTRDKGLKGSACYLGLWIDGSLAGRFGTKETATYSLPPRLTQFRVGADPQGKSLCGIGQSMWTQREFGLKPASVEHFRLKVTNDGSFDIQRTDND